MVEIVPAVLPKDYEELEGALQFLRGAAQWVQVDLVDGEFVEGADPTWPFSESSHLEAVLAEEEGLPFWQDFQFEFDLMVSRPEEIVDDFIQAGASRIVIHLTSTGVMESILDRLEHTHTEAVIALTRNDAVESIELYIQRLAAVQIMGIAKIGVQGQPFDETVLEQIRAVRELYPDLPIQVDGGVNEDTIGQLVEAEATRLVSGSAILSAEEAREKIEELRQYASE